MKNARTAIAVSILLVAVAVGCKLPGFGSKSEPAANSVNTPANTAQTASSSNAFSPSEDPLADVKGASQRFTEVQAFQAVMDTSGGKADVHLELNYSAPDRYHIKNPQMEMIIIGKETYMKVNGSWKKFPVDIGSQLPKMREMLSDEILKSVSGAEYLGDENVNGQSAMVYRYKGKGTGDVSSYTSRVWVSRTSGLPQKIEAVYDGGPIKSMVTNYTYDNVDVEPPTGE